MANLFTLPFLLPSALLTSRSVKERVERTGPVDRYINPDNKKAF